MDNTFITSEYNAVPTLINPTASDVSETSATLGATITSLGDPSVIMERGTCLDTISQNPTTNCIPEGGTTGGIFEYSRTGLVKDTLYYYRGYANNATGRGYSPSGSFFTGVTSALSDLTAGPVTPTIVPLNNATVKLYSDISNTGNAPTSSSFYNFFQITDGPNGSGVVTNLDPVEMEILAKGADEQTISPTSSPYIFSSALTTYSARACADNNSSFMGSITESDEGNNCGPWTNITATSNPIPGGWSGWSDWGVCSGGIQTSTRTCNNPAPANGGTNCVGSSVQTQSCIQTVSGTLTPISPSPCYINYGDDSCNVTFSWNTINPVGESAVTSDYPVPNTIIARGNSSNNITEGDSSFPVPRNSSPRTFYLFNNGVPLDQKTVTSYCVEGTSWNGSECTYIISSPNANLSASPNPIMVGESSILTWSSSNVDSCIGIGFDVGGGDTRSGSVLVSPTVDTPYSIACSGSGGQAYDDTMVYITTGGKKPIFIEN